MSMNNTDGIARTMGPSGVEITFMSSTDLLSLLLRDVLYNTSRLARN